MKIVIPIAGFSRSGGARVLSEFASQWVAAGHEVDFLVNQASEDPYFPTRAGIIYITNGGRAVTPAQRDRGARTNGWLGLAGLLLALRRIGKDYDVVLANHSLTAWPVRLAHCGRARKCYYIQAYEPEFYEHETGFKARIQAWMSVKSYDFDLHQVVNAPVYFGYQNVRARHFVPPGLDFSLFYARPALPDLAHSERIVLGCIGRREPFKGTQFVLDAFELLAAQDPRFHLRVAYGNLPAGYSHPRVDVIVPADDRALADFYRSLDIMIAPGTVQLGAPHYPVMEAMACAVPVITTGYMPASDANAWLVPVGDAAMIAERVHTIVADPVARAAKVAAATTAIAPFEWHTVARDMLTQFQKAS